MSKLTQNRHWKDLLVFLSLLLLIPGAPAQQTSVPVRTVAYEDAFKLFEGRYPKWEQGHLVAWKWDTSASDTGENIAVYDREGRVIGKTRAWLQDASFLRILDAAVRKDGEVAVVGWAITSSGTLAAFLGDVSVTRGSGQFVRTSPFEGRAVSFGADGTIWVLGLELGAGRGREPAADHSMVQHFGTDFVLKDEHLLRSDFSCELAAEGHGGLPLVVTSGDRVGLFAPGCRTWVELSPRGELLGQWKWNPLPAVPGKLQTEEVSFVTLTSDDELYGWKGTMAPGLVRFDRKLSAWVPVETRGAESAGAPLWWLQGSEGDMLVSQTVDKKLAWFKPVKTE